MPSVWAETLAGGAPCARGLVEGEGRVVAASAPPLYTPCKMNGY